MKRNAFECIVFHIVFVLTFMAKKKTFKLPPTDTFVEFKSYHKKLIVPFVV